MLSLLILGSAQAADPLFDALAKVKFINSGLVKATDSFVWGVTTSGRDPATTAANPTAGTVMYLEKYNISNGNWGAGGAFPYLWQQNPAIDISRATNGSTWSNRTDTGGTDTGGTDTGGTDTDTCTVGALNPGYDMPGADIGLSSSDSPAACGASCCATVGCGGFVYITQKEDPTCSSDKTKPGCCFHKKKGLPPVTKSGYKTIVSGTVTGGVPAPTCATDNATHHMDATGPGAACPSGVDCGNMSSWQACRAACCAQPDCGVFTYVNGPKAPNYRVCYLRGLSAAITPSTACAAANPTYDCYTGERPNRPVPPPPPPPPLINIVDPPSGMRSAVPLGGISCGAVELRGDGSLHEWTIMNQSPGGSGKVQSYGDAYFAVRVGATSPIVALQTHPLTSGIKGVTDLSYAGSHPVSRLSTTDSAVMAAGVKSAELFAFSTYKINDMAASARPMASFTFAVATDASWPADGTVEFMMNLPTAIEPDMIRRGTPLGPAASTAAASDCLRSCNSNAACMSWNFDRAAGTCTLQRDAPNMFYALGTDCGLRGAWTYDSTGSCLTLTRPGAGGSNGGMSLCASTASSGSTAAFGTYDSAGGAFVGLNGGKGLNSDLDSAHGAVVVTAKVPPASNATLTITFGWHFPERDHFGKTFGNYYKNLFVDSADAAFGPLAAGAPRTAALTAVVTDILAMQTPFHGSSLEPWLQDHLVNSLSHIRTAMWFDTCPNCHKTQDNRSPGFWRQWEAFDCPDLDSIHNDGERHIPYIMFWPDSTRNKLAAWAGNQQPNGMLAEQIHNANPDQPEGRIMSDSTSMFICYILELLRWSGDVQTLELYYPTVMRAAQWQMNVSAEYGVPLKLQTTYDILGFTQYELSSYSSVFHIMAMRAAAALAKAAGDTASEMAFGAAATRGTESLDVLQWVQNSTWTVTPSTYCADGYTLIGAGLTVAQCQSNCTGSCSNIFVSNANASIDRFCYACDSSIGFSHNDDYTLYSKSGAVIGSWAAASDGCTAKEGCATQHGFFGDALYAQVLAYSAGLGRLVSSDDKIKSHMAAELATNCVRAKGEALVEGCDDAGIVILTGRSPPGVTDWQIWEGGPPNHATLGLRTGEPPATALANFQKSATSWSQRINDQWNTAGIKDTDGYPTVTSHYGFHMVSWHIVLAMSGQLADLSLPTNRSLSFEPRLPAPFTLPLMLPGVLGTVSSPTVGQYEVSLTVGTLDLDVLSVDGTRAPGTRIHLSAGGDPVVWK